MTSAAAIAWIESPEPSGRWGAPGELSVPLNDRALMLADGLFETVLMREGQPRLLAAHLARWHQGAALLGMDSPPAARDLAPLIREAVERSGIREGALRLNWSRGSAAGAARGIAIPGPCRHRFWLQLSAATPCFAPVRVIVSPTEERSATSLLSRCKTFAYGAAIQSRRQAEAAGADDALLVSSAGGLCCGTTANLLVRQEGRWLTPPLSSGCLPGVMRARALELGLAYEANLGELTEAGLFSSSGVLLLNSLSCRPISHLGKSRLGWPGQEPQSAEPASAGLIGASNEAQALWQRLLGPGPG
jgi:branched-subunit amino acid aminotransferase/4-amino-4-deoxychorismate lyase